MGLELVRSGWIWDRSVVNRANRLTDGLNVKRERKKCDKDVPSWVGILL